MILLESLRSASEDRRSLWLDEPEMVLQCRELHEVVPLLQELEQRIAAGYTAAGFVCYEAGPAFLPAGLAGRGLASQHLPLVWFGLAKQFQALQPAELPEHFCAEPEAEVINLELNQTYEEYERSIYRIKQWIERGHTYQVNYTMRYRGEFRGSPRALYCRLRKRQRVNYAAYLETPEWAVVSLSPELFFSAGGSSITVKPMKGTASRGRTSREDLIQAAALHDSPKERSENLMIVDMLRNDLGKICETGSIEVTRPMEVERYETLLQMTSTICGTLKPRTTITDVLRSLFPSGSVTGAPKIRTMQIIGDLEPEPRGIYTGAIGVITPETSVFNVAIRTAVLDRINGRIEMGVGSGILHEADPMREYQECVLKARFLTDSVEEFRLFETILWTPQAGYNHLSLHLDRLLDSAEYFLFPLTRENVEQALRSKEQDLRKELAMARVRVLVDRDARIEAQSAPLQPLLMAPYSACYTTRTTDSADPFLFHKTTRRALYDEELARARAKGFFEAIFRNEKGEITEGAVSNIFVRTGSLVFTPPVSCGLLAGTCRRHLLETQPFRIEERILREKDLRDADEIFVTNALRGLVKVQLTTAS